MAKQPAKQPDSLTWITADAPKTAFVTVDKQLRIYFNAEARDLIGGKSVMLGYDKANKRIVIGSPDIVRPANVKPHKLDKRGYTSARPFLRTLGLTKADLPLRFEYIGKDYTIDEAFAFELTDDPMAGEDGKL